MIRAFLRHLAATASALLAASLAEGLCVALQARGSLVSHALAVTWSAGLAALPSLVVAFLLAWLLAVACDEESSIETARASLGRPEVREVVPAWVGAAAVLTLAVYAFVLGSRRFHNVELAASLVAVATLLLVLVLATLAVVVTRRNRAAVEPRRAARTVRMVATGLAVGVAAWLLLKSAPGLAQLDPRLAAAPLAGGAAYVALDGWLLRRWAPRKVAALTLAGWLGAAGAFWSGGAAPVLAVTTHGAWSRPVISALRALADWDGDGYSSWLGGGDCAPLDPRIHPSATEVPGDGVDNNCVGGDGGRAAAPRRPIWGPSVHGAPTQQNVVIVTIETLRYDHASFVRPGRDTTPNLRELAASALVFERMYSAAPYTRLALASLFSSYAPSEIDWQQLPADKRARRISPSTPWLPELLAARGYDTIAVLTSFSAFTSREGIGFERGFRHYDVSTELEYRGGTMRGFPAAEQVDKALGYVSQASRPFFVWLHLFEPHYRYEQPPGAPVFGTDERSRYDAEIWHADAQLGRFLAGLRRLGVWDETILFVTGDHGEAFGEHDDRWHGTNLFDPQVRTAALLRVPGIRSRRVELSVTFTDVAPTLARVLGDRAAFDQLRGRSLAPLLHRSTLPPGQDGFFVETFEIADGRAYQAAFVAHPLKLVYEETGQRFSLYDLARDPEERRPLDARTDPRGPPLLHELIGYLERARPRGLEPR